MKTTVVLFIVLVTLLPLSANATTLTITSGGAVLNDELFILGAGVGSWIAFGGDDFSVWQLKEPTSFRLIPAFGVEPFVQSIGFYSGRFSGAGVVQVGTQQCFGSDFVSCGDITLTSPGFAIPADWPINTSFVATVPFTATGQLLVAGNQYDLVGYGTVTGTRCLSPCGPYMQTSASLEYRFAVDEPSAPSLTLMVVISVGGLLFIHRRMPLDA